MQEMTAAERDQVSGGGTKIGTTGSGDGQQAIGAAGASLPLGGFRPGSDLVDPDMKATPILF